MKHQRICLLAFLVIFMTAISGCSSSSDDDTVSAENAVSAEPFQVGASVKALVPKDDPDWYEEVCMGGFGILGIRNFGKIMNAKAQGVNDPPYARAMVINQGSQTIAFLSLDAAMIGNKITAEIMDGASKKTGIPAWNIYIAVTHSHSAPDFLGYMGTPLEKQGSITSEYRKFLIDTCIQTIVNANDDKAPSELRISQTQYNPSAIKDPTGKTIIKYGEEIKWVYNRRGWSSLNPEDEAERRDAGLKPNYTNPDVDSTINVIEAVDIATGEPKGVMINYACHPVIVTDTTRKLSRDFCGYLVDYIQKKTGAPTVFIQGTQGDVNPGDVVEEFGADEKNCYGYAKQFGEDVAKQALASMKDQAVIGNEMYVKGTYLMANIDNWLMNILLVVRRSDLELEIKEGNKIEAHVAYIRLGKELQIITYPGEAVTHMGLGVKAGEHKGKNGSEINAIIGPKQLMKAPFKMVAGLTGDSLLYLVPSAEWENSPDPMPGMFGSPYEEMMSMSINGVFADDCREAANNLIKYDGEMK